MLSSGRSGRSASRPLPADPPPRPGGPRRPLGRAAAGVALAVVLAALLGLLAEGGLRVASRLATGEWPETRLAAFHREIASAVRLYRAHPFLNTAPASSVAVEAFGKRASFNSHGYRSPERPVPKPEGVLRVICSGGSTTFDLLAPSDSESWPWRLEEELRGGEAAEQEPAQEGLAVEVWNAGFPGWTSVENLISLGLREVDLDPDLVLLYQGINDLQPGSHRPLDRQYVAGHARQSYRALGLDLEPPGPWDRSLAVERLRDLLLGPTDPWSRLRTEPGAAERHDALAPGAEEVFARNVRSFVAVATASGARVALVTQVVRVREAQREADLAYLAEWVPGLEPEAAPAELERFNDVLRRLASAEERAAPAGSIGEATEEPGAEPVDRGLLLFDLAAEVEWRDEDFTDPMHLSPRGTSRLVAYLAPAVAEALTGTSTPEPRRRRTSP